MRDYQFELERLHQAAADGCLSPSKQSSFVDSKQNKGRLGFVMFLRQTSFVDSGDRAAWSRNRDAWVGDGRLTAASVLLGP
jgi:hypothetical protein